MKTFRVESLKLSHHALLVALHGSRRLLEMHSKALDAKTETYAL